ncbi:sensor histidine kinase [Streptomyces sp. DSM 41982]|uniref:histidine kinase n=1 Tax=Streptomyces evansiae TaxID=3075535 RepID=A0ABD5EC47_9ACTN|nr:MULTISPECIES: sensor histidine kinase [unclassified Streptomyces]MDT0419020.1 sensor histidine kinase [Streptomyces sp. DSM 41982]SCD52045.1 Signal transduction histidine kinase [Streptomyces sp. SolWspMP-sol7th]
MTSEKGPTTSETGPANSAKEYRALFAGARSPWTRLLPWGVALVLAVVLLPVQLNLLVSDYRLDGGLASALAIAQAAPLLLAVVRPLTAWYVIFAVDVMGALVLLSADLGKPLLWPFPAPVIVGYLGLCLALGLRESRRTLLGVWLATAGATAVLEFLRPDDAHANGIVLAVLSGVALVLAAALKERYEVNRRLVVQEAISEAERDRRTLLEERTRIARELHDVVAHHMSVITVQADTAAYRLADVPPDVREEFTSIAATARASLSEMRRLLGVLRNEETRGELAPQPGLAQIGRLVEATARAGIPVEYAPCEAGVPEAVGLSAYRIVQEALANVVRHAPGAPARVALSSDGASLTVLVVNEPPPEPPGGPLETSGTGHGLVGMRERVRLVGGTLDTGPLPDGGYRVAARLPLTERDRT